MATIIKRSAVAFIIIIGFVMLFSTAAQAQGMRTTVEEQVKMLKDSLKLDSTQVIKITKIIGEQREEMTTMRNEKQDDREAMRAAMQEIRTKTDEKIKAILKGDQLKKYEEIIKVQRERREQRMKEGNR